MELFLGETPHRVMLFFVYRRRQFELWNDVEIGTRVETCLRNYIFADEISIFIIFIDVCSST
jgi:hypothetical protein